jgi:acetylornithine deacetylase
MPAVIDTLADLVRINSVNPSYEGGVPELALANYVERFFQQRGIEVWRQWVYPERPNILARVQGRNPHRRVVLEAHLDTVSVRGMTIDPWEPNIVDGKLFGRGACDTKGGLAAMMHSVARLVEERTVPACEVIFAATIDEEYSFRGVVALCDSLAPGPVDPQVLCQELAPRQPWTAQAALVAEPTDLRAVIASKGVLRWKVETLGTAAHSSKPHLGVNAIEHMAHLILAIEQDSHRLATHAHPLLGTATCNVGVIRGGVQVNFVPDRCEIEIDRRLLPHENREDVLQQYARLFDQLASQHTGLRYVMHPPMLSDRPLETSPAAPAVCTLQNVLSELGLDSQVCGVPYGSDASKLSAIGIPSIILGPGSIDQAHAAEEYIECHQVELAAQVYLDFLQAME